MPLDSATRASGEATLIWSSMLRARLTKTETSRAWPSSAEPMADFIRVIVSWALASMAARSGATASAPM
jgi:hypothetical protein